MKRVKFTYEQEKIKQPIIYDLGHKFKIVTNVRRADVREDMGWVVLELEGDEANVEQAVQYLIDEGVQVEVLEEGEERSV